jgi:hypothetical protein
MAIKVSGTTVINDSRGVVNIASGVITGIQSGGTVVGAGATILNFVGTGNSITAAGGVVSIRLAGNVSIGTVPPSSPESGNLWYDSGSARLFVYYTDTNSSQWVDTSPFNGLNDIFISGPLLVGSNIPTGTVNQNLQITGGGYISGNTGIGLTNPVTPLHISDGNSDVSSALYTSDYLTISAQNTAPGFNIIAASNASSGHRGVFKATRARGTLSSPLVPNNNDNTFSLLGAIYDGSITRATAAINMDVDGAVGVGTAPQRISFWTGTGSSRLERARLTSTGNFGIGTVNPQAKLHVVGDSLVTGISTIGLGNTSSPSNSQLSFELTSNTNLRIKVRGTDGVLRSANITLA